VYTLAHAEVLYDSTMGLLSFWFTRETSLSVMREKPLLFIKTILWDKVGKKSTLSAASG
jgi:hypothetical protein